MEQYASNSDKSKMEEAPRPKMEKVIVGSAKMAGSFLADDLNAVKNYIFKDVLIPVVKRAIDDIITNGAHMLLYGESSRPSRNGIASRISYRDCYDSPNSYRRRDYDRDRDRDRDRRDVEATPRRTNNGFDYDQIVFSSRGDAELVLTMLEENIERYDFVTVNDLYDMSDVTNENSQACKYGWSDLSRARVISDVDGYRLKLPRALPLD